MFWLLFLPQCVYSFLAMLFCAGIRAVRLILFGEARPIEREVRPSRSFLPMSFRILIGSAHSFHRRFPCSVLSPRQRLFERAWFAFTETLLAMTIFRDEFNAQLITLFAFLLAMKCLHWLLQDRVEFVRALFPEQE